MTVQATYIGNVNQPVNVSLAGTSSTNIFTATDNTITVASWAFANTTAGAVTCSITWYSAQNATDYLIWVGSVPATTTAIVSDTPIRMRKGDIIKAVGAAGVRITLINMLNFALNGQ